jgi:GNAT superfamily N-acetyltransferase
MKIVIRIAQRQDLPQVYKIEKRSYLPELQANRDALLHRFEIFGIWVATVNGKVIGFFTGVPVRLSWPRPNIRELIKNRNHYYKPWFDIYKKGGKFNTLYITSTTVEPKYQGKGVGKALVKYSLRLAKKLGLKYRASVLRIPGYNSYYKHTHKPPERYIEEVEGGKTKSHLLSLYLKLGFRLGKPIPNYEPDRSSRNFGLFAYKRVT